MANEKYLDLTGLEQLVTDIKSYVSTNASKVFSISSFDTVPSTTLEAIKVGDVVSVGAANNKSDYICTRRYGDDAKFVDLLHINFTDGTITVRYYTKTSDTWAASSTASITKRFNYDSTNKLSADYTSDGTNNKVLTAALKTLITTVITESSGETTVTADHAKFDDAAIKTGTSNGIPVYSDLLTLLNNIIDIAEGRTDTIVLSDQTQTGYINSRFASNDEYIGASPSEEIKDISGNTIVLGDLKVGDILLITDTGYPDRWLAVKNDNDLRFYTLEIKMTIDSTPTQNHSNPVSSGGVYTALQGKQDTMTAITNAEIDALFE